MSNKLSIEEVGERVGLEGLEYAVMNYLSDDNIADEELSKLWKQARDSMKAVETYLETKLGETFFENF